jgi:hypothetical protein
MLSQYLENKGGMGRTLFNKRAVCHKKPETQKHHTDSNKTGITPVLLVLEVQGAP